MLQFDPNAYNPDENQFKPIPIGPYRVRVEDAQEKTSKSGNNMVEVTLSVSGQSGKLWYYIVENEWMNSNIGNMCESLGCLEEVAKNPTEWIHIIQGKVGAVMVKHDRWDGELTAKIKYWMNRSKQNSLPEWVEIEKNDGCPF